MNLNTIPYTKLRQVLFFLYMCALCAHNTNSFFDTWFLRGIFALLFSLEAAAVYAEKKLPRFNWKSYLAAFSCFVAYVLLRCIGAPSLSDAFSLSYWFGFIQILFIAYVLEQNVRTLNDARWYLSLVLYALVYTLVILVIRTPAQSWGQNRLGADIGLNPNNLGLMCVTGAAISVYFAQKKRWYYLLALAFLALSVFTGSKKGMLMVLIVCGLFLIFKERGEKLLKNLIFICVFAIVFFVVVMNVDFLYEVAGKRLENMILAFLGAGGGTSEIERTFYADHAAGMFLEKPLFGWGTNSFVTQMRQLEYSHVAYCHNNYLELLATLGIVGLVLYYSVQVRILIKGIAAYIRSCSLEVTLVLAVIIANMLGEFYFVSFFERFTQITILLMFILLNKSIQKEGSKVGQSQKK